MKYLLLFFLLESSFASVKTTLTIKDKKIMLTNTSEIIWNKVCKQSEMGCAGFKIKTERKPNIKFGLLKIVANNLQPQYLNDYCQKVFNLGHKNKNTQIKKISHCLWTENDLEVSFFLKKNILFSLTHEKDIEENKIFEGIKVYE